MSTAGRFPFGAGVADFATKQTGAYLSLAAGAVITMWTAQTGGTQITDLLAADGVTPITSVTTLADGTLPLFYGPAGLTVMWANGGGAELSRIQSDPSAAYGPGSPQWLEAIGGSFGFGFNTVSTYDSGTGLPTAATVLWPDGTGGSMTGTIDSGGNGYSGWVVTWTGATTHTVTVTGITYDANGNALGPTSVAVA